MKRTIVVITDLGKTYWQGFLESFFKKDIQHNGIIEDFSERWANRSPSKHTVEAMRFAWDSENHIACLIQQEGIPLENKKKFQNLMNTWRLDEGEIGIAAHHNGGQVNVTEINVPKCHRAVTFHNELEKDKVWVATKKLFDSFLESKRDVKMFNDLWNLLIPSRIEMICELRNNVLTPLVALDLLQQATKHDVSLKKQIREVLSGEDKTKTNSYDNDWQSLSRNLFGEDDFCVVGDDNIRVSFSTFIEQLRNKEDLMINRGLLELFAEELEDKINKL